MERKIVTLHKTLFKRICKRNKQETKIYTNCNNRVKLKKQKKKLKKLYKYAKC